MREFIGHTDGGIITDGLVFYIDAINRLTYVGGETTCRDMTLNVGGTLYNTIDFDGEAWVFDSTDQYIDFGNPDSLNFGTDDFSMTMWFYRNANVTTNLRTFSKGALNGDDEYAGFTCFGSDAGIYFGVVAIGGGERVGASWAYNSLNTPQMFTAVCDRGTGKVRTYGNGEYIAESVATLGGGTVSNGSQDFVVGMYNTNLYFWDGGIYSIMFHNKTLNPTEIKQNYNSMKYRFI